MAGTKTQGVVTVDGREVTVTNPDKVLWPEMGITKLMYLERLAALSPCLIRYCEGRYLTTIRWPHGIHGKSFYQKNVPDRAPDFVRTADHNGIRYVVLDSLATLIWLGNLACLEFHPSFDRIGDELRPTEWVIDIDPSLEEEPRIMEAAALVGELLHSLGIRAVPKTSGATGVQIVVPLVYGPTFEELREIGQFVGEFLANKHPKLFTIERMKKNRGDLIYFDYLQHYAGKTLSAPYTPRARAAASVSTPLTWEEVESGVRPADFHLLNIVERLSRVGDLIASAPQQDLRPILAFIRRQRAGTRR